MNVITRTSFFSVVDDSDSFSFSSSFLSSLTSDVSEVVSFCSDTEVSDCSVLTTTESSSWVLSFSEDLSSSGFSF